MKRLCACGCGKQVSPGRLWRRGHYHTGRLGEKAPNWKDGTSQVNSYRTLYAPDNPRARTSKNSHVREDVLVVEAAAGIYLPSKTEIFHVNGDKSDSRNSNLVVCQDRKYHYLIKKRQRAYLATGNAHALQCKRCGRWGLPEIFNEDKDGHRGPCKRYLGDLRLKK